MEHLRFASACNTEDLVKVFDPEYSKNLNCPLAEHVLRLLVIELIGRGVDLNDQMHEAFVGPDPKEKDEY